MVFRSCSVLREDAEALWLLEAFGVIGETVGAFLGLVIWSLIFGADEELAMTRSRMSLECHRKIL